MRGHGTAAKYVGCLHVLSCLVYAVLVLVGEIDWMRPCIMRHRGLFDFYLHQSSSLCW